MLELRARLVVGELPVDAGLRGIPLIGPGLRLASEGVDIWDPTAQALLGEDAQFDFGHVEPAAVLWRVVDFQPLQQAPAIERGVALQLPLQQVHQRGPVPLRGVEALQGVDGGEYPDTPAALDAVRALRAGQTTEDEGPPPVADGPCRD